MEHKLTIVPIERNDDASLLSGPPYDGLIRCSRRIIFRDGKNIVTRFPQCLDGRERHDLIRE